MWGRPEEERGPRGRRRRVGSGDPGAGAEGGKGPGWLGAGPGAVAVAGAAARGAGLLGPGHPLPVPWRSGFDSGCTGGSRGRRATCGVRPPRRTGTLPLGDPPPRVPREPAGPPGGRERRRLRRHHEAAVGRAAARRPALRTR